MSLPEIVEENEEDNEIKASPEQLKKNKRQVLTILLVMLSSTCVGLVVLTLLLWVTLKNYLPAG
jgi:hypothetical protein